MFPKISQMVVALAAVASSSVYAADCVSGAQTTGSCTVPAGISSMTISITGGGGGGGDGASSIYSGGGGGGGGNCTLTNFAVTAGSALTISVGAGGAPPIPAGFPYGDPGGDSSVVLGGTTYRGSAGTGGFNGIPAGFGGGGAVHGPGGAGGSATCTGGTITAGQYGAVGTALAGGEGGAGGDSPPPGAAGGDGGLATASGSSGLGGSVVLTFASASASVATVPTLSEWAMIFLASLMGMLAIRRMRPQ